MALSSPGTGVAAATDSAQAPRPTRGLLPLLLLGNTVMYALYIGVPGFVLALQVAGIDPANKVSNMTVVSGVSAVFATIFNPIAGALSDRSGRRNPWILGGGIGALAVMALLGSVNTVLLVTIVWCLGQAAMNFYQAALTSVVPDRIPVASRGKASAAVGLGIPIGSTIGALVGAAVSDSYRTGYLVFGAMVAVAAVIFTACAKEERRPGKPPVPFKEQAKSFASALANHDFRWAFIGRALLILGYFGVLGFQLYILQDHTKLPAGMDAPAAAAILTMVNSFASVISTVLGGWLSDKYNRRKLFVAVSALLAAVAMIFPALSSSWTAMLIFGAINGLGFGCYMAVDTALVTMVLPKSEDAARDMGILNVANAGPQIAAPFVAGLVVQLSGGYTALFLVAAVLSLLGALAVYPIRSVR
ncbi:MFS transporter [Streptomyces spiroverticillatus]|uniref:MFS transporter n=1 Tax=Streptomyces finlayi TaxID=67296 RepID=A0A918X3D7_9ACTN|nr:MFS transporter [Streptomyces finlayi]GHA26660.1 MFS transporter [Streptomyces spiroverticillatus]GHD08091.1 MFS transporter [Streptomyces finlayi]